MLLYSFIKLHWHGVVLLEILSEGEGDCRIAPSPTEKKLQKAQDNKNKVNNKHKTFVNFFQRIHYYVANIEFQEKKPWDFFYLTALL